MIGSKVAKRYAKALFGLGQEDGQYDKYGQDLSEFVGFCAQNDEFRQVIWILYWKRVISQEWLKVFYNFYWIRIE